MRKLTEKVALVAQIVLSLVFVLTAFLYMSNVFVQQANWKDNNVLIMLMVVLAVGFATLSFYLLFQNFSQSQSLKRLLLFCDSQSTTYVSVKVLKRLVKQCTKTSDGVHVKKLRVREDGKNGFVLTLRVHVNADDISQSIDALRCALQECLQQRLGVKFSQINFEIDKLEGKHAVPSAKVQQQAVTLGEERQIATDIYENPIDEQRAIVVTQEGEQADENAPEQPQEQEETIETQVESPQDDQPTEQEEQTETTEQE